MFLIIYAYANVPSLPVATEKHPTPVLVRRRVRMSPRRLQVLLLDGIGWDGMGWRRWRQLCDTRENVTRWRQYKNTPKPIREYQYLSTKSCVLHCSASSYKLVILLGDWTNALTHCALTVRGKSDLVKTELTGGPRREASTHGHFADLTGNVLGVSSIAIALCLFGLVYHVYHIYEKHCAPVLVNFRKRCLKSHLPTYLPTYQVLSCTPN